ncbi:MAG: NAD(P)H-dependent oxidoreductase subunit E [Candidatus Izemoplasmatales bacterium]|nr:NAD(P)H-dependent oxidoreductase subunit E [Candidatus Izemoplasmatales bacterium]
MLLDKILEKYPQQEDSLLEILLAFQDAKINHFISEDEVRQIASYLHISEAKVCSVLSFYTFFRTENKGKHVIQVCGGVPCHVESDFNVAKTLEKELGIKVNETTENQQFTLEYTSCIGLCDEAPAMRIDDKVYTKLTPNKIKAILAEYRVYM